MRKIKQNVSQGPRRQVAHLGQGQKLLTVNYVALSVVGQHVGQSDVARNVSSGFGAVMSCDVADDLLGKAPSAK